VIYGLPGFGFGAVTVARIRATWGHGWENDLSGCLWRICGEFLGRLKLPFFQSGSNNSAEFKTSRADSSHWSRRSEWWGGFTMFHPCQQCKLAPFSHFQRHKFQLANHKISSVANPMPRTSINNLLGMVYKFIPSTYVFLLVTLIVLDEIVLSHTNIYELPRPPKIFWWFSWLSHPLRGPS
jgi:hypothetical protein